MTNAVDTVADELPQLHVGDHVADREASDGATMLVVGVPLETADEYDIGDGRTVADANPDYAADDDVVEVIFPSRTDKQLETSDRYAYPRGRLDPVAPVHDRDEGDGIDPDVRRVAEHIVETHTTIDERLEDLERRMDRAERDIDLVEGGAF